MESKTDKEIDLRIIEAKELRKLKFKEAGKRENRKLTIKQLKFINAYSKTFNGTQSAIMAGYSKKSAGTVGHKLLKNPLIKERLDMIKQEEIDRLGIDDKYVLENIKETAERCMQKVPVMYFDKTDKSYKQKIDEKTGEGMWQFEAGNALKGLELLGKYSGTFNDENKGITNNININLESLLAKVTDEKEW